MTGPLLVGTELEQAIARAMVESRLLWALYCVERERQRYTYVKPTMTNALSGPQTITPRGVR